MLDRQLNELTVTVLDEFAPGIMKVIADALPQGWRMVVPRGDEPADRVEAVREAEVILVMATRLSSTLLEAAPRLRFIQKLGAGLDNIDLDYCGRKDIGVARLQAGNAIPVAEHTLLLMLAAYRRLITLDHQVRSGEWKREEARAVSRQIDSKTIGLIGFGAVGRAVAKLLLGFDVRIIYCDPIPAPREIEQERRAERVSLEEVLSQSDIVSLHLPLERETAGMINADRIASMKRGAVLINCARGGIVDEAALHRALVSGHISAAGIDCFTHEPPTGSPLLDLEQTVVSPHTAGGTVDNFRPVVERAVRNAQRYLAGEDISPLELVVAGSRRTVAGR